MKDNIEYVDLEIQKIKEDLKQLDEKLNTFIINYQKDIDNINKIIKNIKPYIR